MTTTLGGKTAIIFGGSRGIGAAIVKRMTADGAAVGFTYAGSTAAAAAVEQEAGALAIRADSADAGAVRGAVEQVVTHFGRLDIAVISAGLLMRGGIDSFAVEDFDRMLAVNVRGVFLAMQAAARHLSDGGRIITIGSVSADRTGFPGSSVYSMTKGAVASLVRGAAIDLAPRGITVNNIQPGPTATDMGGTAEIEAKVRPLLPVGRFGRPEEIAAMAAYLASPEASFVTGASLTVDGGYSA